ncbi:MAG: hypothetical protein ACTSU5_13455 [Promethearchaeota archaeon]
MPDMIRIPRAWSPRIRRIAEQYNNIRDKNDENALRPVLGELLEILSDPSLDTRERVMSTFVLEQVNLAGLEEWVAREVVERYPDEENPKVREFMLYFIGKVLLREAFLPLIEKYEDFFAEIARDGSNNVQAFAREFLDDVAELRQRIELEREKVEKELKKFKELVDSSIKKMIADADAISKDALMLDYKKAALVKEKMERRIRDFSKKNERLEEKIRRAREDSSRKYGTFKNASVEVLEKWKHERSEREALIKKVHCILRIQSKIFLIISYIQKKDKQEFSEEDIQAIQAETNYSERDIMNILEKLVDEEVIPNFFPSKREEEKMEGEDVGEDGGEEGRND